jgi:hypothetical protein
VTDRSQGRTRWGRAPWQPKPASSPLPLPVLSPLLWHRKTICGGGDGDPAPLFVRRLVIFVYCSPCVLFIRLATDKTGTESSLYFVHLRIGSRLLPICFPNYPREAFTRGFCLPLGFGWTPRIGLSLMGKTVKKRFYSDIFRGTTRVEQPVEFAYPNDSRILIASMLSWIARSIYLCIH